MKTLQQINDEISSYTETNCPNCYAHLLRNGRLHLDGKFIISDLKVILEIIEGKK